VRATGGPWPPPPLPRPLTAEVGTPVEPLRAAIWTEAFNGAEVDEGCRAAAVSCATTLERAGHDVSVAAPPELSAPELWEAMTTALAANTAADLQQWERRLGRPIAEDDLEVVTWRIVDAGRRVTALELLDALATMQRVARAAELWWADHDLLVTPTAAAPALPVGAYLAVYRSGRGSAFTRVFNATGQPAISLPLGWPDDGLPRGVQLVAPYGREDVLVRVASFLESADPWWPRYRQLDRL